MSEEKINVEEFKFEPIKGYPMLNWKGKRPFSSTQYYPAQLKERYGDENHDGWMNKLFWGDNLQVMSHLLKEYRGKVNLIYIDPPFDSKADYKKRISLKGIGAEGSMNSFEEKQYTDLWNNDEYLQFMYERLFLLKELLCDGGTIFIHCDHRMNSYLRILMDEIFGREAHVNELIWQKIRTTKAQSTGFGGVHDTILFYCKNKLGSFHTQRKELKESYIKSHYKPHPVNGRYFTDVSLLQKGAGPARNFGDKVISPPPGRHWVWGQEKIDKAMKEDRIWFNSKGTPRKVQYLDEMEGDVVSDLWFDIFPINSQALEDTGYPTQKPASLLERVISCATNEGDLVFDCFMGAGTTPDVAMKMGRRFIGADINLGAIQIATKRINSSVKMLVENEDDISKFWTGFEVYNVNHYDVFRNELEAKSLIAEALEIVPISNSVYDGEKDGRMVKILSINRIATRVDLNELINGIDYKVYKKRKEDNPNKVVEKILLVCMGHEADLKAGLELAVKEAGFEIDVEVVDILRDKSSLEFKRDAEAKIEIKNGKLIIEKFYPMNLLQKLSIQKSKVNDWRELVESVMIDWNFDGGILSPSTVDIPGKKDLVTGEYEIPGDSGTIRVKITDILSESLEIEVHNG
ncbi:MAG: site-specific DNA-methyltransferase [Halobacteriovorax sp.]|nr:site-specific DNA-methyltransferase [Halobacteriovorax sp.]|tara:strand:- start:343098 stop:344993 length:1896 start_codon:yes stop_codon:yes gene_type:complete